MATKKRTKKKATKKATRKATRKRPATKKRTAKKATRKATRKKAATRKAATRKAATRKAATRKGATRKKAAGKKRTKRKPSAAFMKPLTPSAVLAEVVGSRPLPRTQVVKKLWQYIRKHKLQDNVKRQFINADKRLKAVFGGRSRVSMFEMTKLVSKHLR